jgi:hypothetical protein
MKISSLHESSVSKMLQGAIGKNYFTRLPWPSQMRAPSGKTVYPQMAGNYGAYMEKRPRLKGYFGGALTRITKI